MFLRYHVCEIRTDERAGGRSDHEGDRRDEDQGRTRSGYGKGQDVKHPTPCSWRTKRHEVERRQQDGSIVASQQDVTAGRRDGVFGEEIVTCSRDGDAGRRRCVCSGAQRGGVSVG